MTTRHEGEKGEGKNQVPRTCQRAETLMIMMMINSIVVATNEKPIAMIEYNRSH